jgi:hypothetical protein
VEKLWSSFEENLVALHVGDAPEPRVLFATDKFGRIYQLSENRDVDLLAQTDQEQVTQLVGTDAGLLVATAQAGKLLRLGRAPAAAGSYETSVRDTGKVSRWGRLGWRGSLPEGTQVEFSTRSGNSSRPDASWSEWSPAIRAANGVAEGDAAIASPAARYIQWKAALRGRGESLPVLERVRVTYLPQNAPPVVHSIAISTSASEQGDASATPATGGGAAQADSTPSFSMTVTGTGEEAAPSASSTPQQTIQGNHGKRLMLTWYADDPDGDKLVASLSFRGEGESTWKVLKKDMAETSYSLDAGTLADGAYWFRVAVSDSPANPPEAAQTAERISQRVLIDHTPPAVRLLGVESRATVRFEAVDEASMLQSAEYSLNAGAWVPVYADDGIVDSRRESFTIRLADLPAGEHLLTLRVRDHAGNAGLGKALIP